MIRGIVARAYIGIASGSPCVASLSMYRSEGALYVFFRTLESSGQVNLMLFSATFRFRELKALLASIRSTASLSSFKKHSLAEWIAA